MTNSEVVPKRAIGQRELYNVPFILAAVSFFNFLHRIVLSILLETIKLELGFSDTRLGLLGGFQTGGAVGMAFGSPRQVGSRTTTAGAWRSICWEWHCDLAAGLLCPRS